MSAKRLTIKNPCGERWAEMTPQGAGRHCAACDKVVIDLTAADVHSAFRQISLSERSVCVRLLPKHLDYVHEDSVPGQQNFSLRAIAAGATIVAFSALGACSSGPQPAQTANGEIAVHPTAKSTGNPENSGSSGRAAKEFPKTRESKTRTYTLLVKFESTDEVFPGAFVTISHGGKNDVMRTDSKGICSFTIAEKRFKVSVENPHSSAVGLTQRDFKSGSAVAELEYVPIMGEVAVDEISR